MSAVLFSGDLLVISRVQNAATAAGIAVQVTSSLTQAVENCESLISSSYSRPELGSKAVEPRDSHTWQIGKPTLVIVDLSTPGLDVAGFVKRLRGIKASDAMSELRIIAFGPHVHEDRLAAAREAGCDEVMSRGQFFGAIDAILAG